MSSPTCSQQCGLIRVTVWEQSCLGLCQGPCWSLVWARRSGGGSGEVVSVLSQRELSGPSPWWALFACDSLPLIFLHFCYWYCCCYCSFLILLLFPLNCSNLNPRSSPFVDLNSPFQLVAGGREMSEWQHGLEGLSGSTKFLNLNSHTVFFVLTCF